MNGLNDFQSNVKGINWYFVNLSEIGMNRYGLLQKFDKFTKFMEKLNCSVDEFCEIIDFHGIPDRHLFEYSVSGGTSSLLVKENAIYTKKYVKNGWGYKWVETHYDVYIKPNTYVDLYFAIIAKELLAKRYPFLMEVPFVSLEKRFTDKINGLPKTTMAKLNYIDSSIIFDEELTINDLIKLYTDESYKDSYVNEKIWNVYGDCSHIYFTLDKEKQYSLSVPMEAFINKDWDAIENEEVHGYPMYDEYDNLIKGKWFKGKQKDAPFFNHPLVRALKEILTK